MTLLAAPPAVLAGEPSAPTADPWPRWEAACVAGGRDGELTADVVQTLRALDADPRPPARLAAAVDALLGLAVLRRSGGRSPLCWNPDKRHGRRLVADAGSTGQLVALADAQSGGGRIKRANRALRLLVRLLEKRAAAASPKAAPLVRLVLALSSLETSQRHLTPPFVALAARHEASAANAWVPAYLAGAAATAHVEGRTHARLLRAMREFDAVLAPAWPALGPSAHLPFYACSYADPELDAPVKRHVNALFRGELSEDAAEWEARAARGAAAPRQRLRVAVLSAVWFRRHAVHRTLARYVRALLARPDRFEVELVRLAPPHDDDDTDGFAAVHDAAGARMADTVSRVLELCRGGVGSGGSFAYDAVYLPDVGMSAASVAAANVRLAPVMLAGVGHSVSTHGSLVDFYVSGDQAEPPERPERHYSESLLLLPGAGVAHLPPVHDRRSVRLAPLPPASREDAELRINCAFTGQKVVSGFVEALAEIVRGARRRLLLRFFPSADSTATATLLKLKLSRALGAGGPLGHRVHVMPRLPHDQYWVEMQRGHVMLESSPYGGCNTVVDALHLGLPMVTWEGDMWHGRVGSLALRRAVPGLVRELVATSREGFVSRALALVNDPALLARVSDEFRRAPFEAALLSPSARGHEDDPRRGRAGGGEGARRLVSASEESFFGAAVELARRLRAATPAGSPLPPVVYLRDEVSGVDAATGAPLLRESAPSAREDL